MAKITQNTATELLLKSFNSKKKVFNEQFIHTDQ